MLIWIQRSIEAVAVTANHATHESDLSFLCYVSAFVLWSMNVTLDCPPWFRREVRRLAGVFLGHEPTRRVSSTLLRIVPALLLSRFSISCPVQGVYVSPNFTYIGETLRFIAQVHPPQSVCVSSLRLRQYVAAVKLHAKLPVRTEGHNNCQTLADYVGPYSIPLGCLEMIFDFISPSYGLRCYV